MVGKERYLWSFQFQMHGVKRMWWAYFQDWPAIQACLAELLKAFPALELQRLETCQDGLRILNYFFASTSSEQERADAGVGEMVCERDRQFFPLVPSACDYLTSFRASLGDMVRGFAL